MEETDGHLCRVCENHFTNLALHRCSQPQVPSIKNFVTLKRLGKGAFGTVFLAQKKSTHDLFAIKMIQKTALKKKWIFAERNHLNAVDSPYTVKLYSTFQNRRYVYMVMEYVEGSPFDSLIKQNPGGFPEPDVKLYMAQLLVALKHLHQREVSHRDLKPENIILQKGGNLKLIDFGYSTSPHFSGDEGESFLAPTPPTLPEGRTNLRYTAVGTPLYAPPETLLNSSKGYDSKKVDIWSLGVILFEFLVGKTPFTAKDFNSYKNVIRNYCNDPNGYTFPVGCHPIGGTVLLSSEALDLLRCLLNPVPEKRPTVEQAQAHPFFADIMWERLESVSNCPRTNYSTPIDFGDSQELEDVVLDEKLSFQNSPTFALYQNFDLMSIKQFKALNESLF